MLVSSLAYSSTLKIDMTHSSEIPVDFQRTTQHCIPEDGTLSLKFFIWLCGLVVRVHGYRSRGPGFDSRRYKILWEVVGLERGPLSFVRITEELLEWRSSGSGQENRINDRGDPLRWPRDTLYPQKLELTSPTSGSHSVGIVRLRTKGHGVYLFFYYKLDVGRRQKMKDN
jgi:hypothetical protein